MDEKLIVNNKEFIVTLCKRFLNCEIEESNFKEGYYDKDEDLYISYLSQSYIIRYDQVKEKYVLYHKNTRGFNSQKISYHCEFECLSLPSVIQKLSTRHNPKDLVNKNKDLLKKRGIKLE